MEKKSSVLLIFTGGTISMGENPDTQSLAPLDTEQVLSFIPELKMLNINIASVSFHPLIDSSDLTPESLVHIAEVIASHYNAFDVVDVLHGTEIVRAACRT